MERDAIIAAIAQGLRHHTPELAAAPIGETTGLRAAGITGGHDLRLVLDRVCRDLDVATLVVGPGQAATVGDLADLLEACPERHPPRVREHCVSCRRTADSIAELMARCPHPDCEARATIYRTAEAAA